MSTGKPRHLTVIVLLLILASYGCQKETNVNINFQRGIASTRSYVFAQQMMTQIMATYFKAITDSALIVEGFGFVDGAAVYYFADEQPRRITFDYPSYSVVDPYGHYRGGLIHATTSQGFREKDAVVQFRFDNFLYNLDTVQIDSMMLVNNSAVNGSNNNFNVSASRVTYDFSDSTGTLTFGFEQEFSLFKYQNTLYYNPMDSIGISGYLSGNTARDLDFSAGNGSDSALLFSYQCNWLKAGVVQIETDMFKYPATAYFQSADSCENVYLVVIDESPFTVLIEE